MKKIIILFVIFVSMITISNAAKRVWLTDKQHGGIGGFFNRFSDVKSEFAFTRDMGGITYDYFNLTCYNPGWTKCALQKSSIVIDPTDPLDYIWEKYDGLIVEKLNYCIDYADKMGIEDKLIGRASIKVTVPELVELNSLFVFDFTWEFKDVENGKIRIEAFILKL